tara:strand:+ start:252 stop:758 length:507 start_codon:yes stop_codon:yes gene_type:complete
MKIIVNNKKGIIFLILISLSLILSGYLIIRGINHQIYLSNMKYEEKVLSNYYNSPWGGLTISHRFGPGKSTENPPDILEAGGYIRKLQYNKDGSVASFTLHTLQNKKFEFFIRPEIVPLYEDGVDSVVEFEAYSKCDCLIALHFTKLYESDYGLIPIVMFPVVNAELE